MAKKPFVVLDAEILSSSVWAEAAHVRIVWITLLILCDTEGNVGASIPGIANAAGVSLAEAESAMTRLQEPDPYSRTTANEGRRLERIERGWKVLNFIEHLDRLSSERKKARDRVWRSRQRARERKETTSNDTATTQRRQSSQGVEIREKRPETKEQTTDNVNIVPKTDSAIAVVAAPAVPLTASVKVPEPWDFYMGSFNAAFKRRLSVSPKIQERVKARLKDGYKPWQIISLPILIEAQGLPNEMRKGMLPEVPLRDGRSPRTTNGQTWGATDWAARCFGKVDQTILDERLTSIAEAFGVLGRLKELGVSTRVDSGL